MRAWIIALSLLVASNQAFAGEPPAKIVTLGDSITRGVRTGVKADETFASQLQKALQKEKLNAEVVNVGVGGERTDQALKRLDAVLKLKPKVVAIMYGTNDSYVDKGAKEPRISAEEYGKNLQKLVAELRKAGVTPILMTPPCWGDKSPPDGAGKHPNISLERYVKVCRDVAKETKTPLVDHFAYWTRQNAAGTDIGTWTTDQYHPNPRGHEEMMKLMLPVVQRILNTKSK